MTESDDDVMLPGDSSDPSDGSTESTRTRHPYTNDAAALLIVAGGLALIGAASIGWSDLSTVPQDVRVALWIPMTAVAVAWLFGGGAVKAANSLTGGD